MTNKEKEKALRLAQKGDKSWREIAKLIGVPRSTVSGYLRTVVKNVVPENVPKILVLDVETAPLVAHVWKLWDNNVGLNQIEKDWHLLSFAAKWLGTPEHECVYMDQRNEPDIENDTNLCVELSNLINQADFIIAQNGRKFDMKKIRARIILNDLPAVKPVRIIDTLEIVKQEFGFTSNKLEYMTDKLCTKYKKLKHNKFSGHELWMEVMKGNKKAWEEMEKYNIHDILSLEELYMIVRAHSTKHPGMGIFSPTGKVVCRVCGSDQLTQDGYWYTNLSKYTLYKCSCGAWSRGRKTTTTKQERELILSAPL